MYTQNSTGFYIQSETHRWGVKGEPVLLLLAGNPPPHSLQFGVRLTTPTAQPTLLISVLPVRLHPRPPGHPGFPLKCLGKAGRAIFAVSLREPASRDDDMGQECAGTRRPRDSHPRTCPTNLLQPLAPGLPAPDTCPLFKLPRPPLSPSNTWMDRRPRERRERPGASGRAQGC